MVDLARTLATLRRHFATALPDDYLRELILANVDLNRTVSDDTVGDPEGRELLMEALGRNLQLPTWPRELDTDGYRHYFYARYGSAIIQLGGTFSHIRMEPSEEPAAHGPAHATMSTVPDTPSALDTFDDTRPAQGESH